MKGYCQVKKGKLKTDGECGQYCLFFLVLAPGKWPNLMHLAPQSLLSWPLPELSFVNLTVPSRWLSLQPLLRTLPAVAAQVGRRSSPTAPAGEKLFVDYAGATVPVENPRTTTRLDPRYELLLGQVVIKVPANSELERSNPYWRGEQ